MATVDVVYEKIHQRHDPRWCVSVGHGDASLRVCVTCVIELMNCQDVSVIVYFADFFLLILCVFPYCWSLLVY